jgi:1-acyl-sn-glycerol-3-phosphate acyltransferase
MVPMLWIGLIIIWIALIFWARRVVEGPRGDFESGFALWLIQVYARLYHRLHVTNPQLAQSLTGPAIVVANHTSGIDPLLIQAACPREIRWMMGADMAVDRLGWLHLRPIWDWSGIIRVDRSGNDRTSVRKALDYLAAGGIIGIFPEGKIATPRGSLLPFMPGIGLIAARSAAPILCVTIADTPECEGIVQSLKTRSQSRVNFMELIDPKVRQWSASDIAPGLEARFRNWITGEASRRG